MTKMFPQISKRKSLRSNIRSNFKSLLDPYNEDKLNLNKEKHNELKSELGDSINTKQLKQPMTQDCLYPSYSKRGSFTFKSPKIPNVKVQSKTTLKKGTKPIPLNSEKIINGKAKSDNKVSKKNDTDKKSKTANNVQQSFVQLEKISQKALNCQKKGELITESQSKLCENTLRTDSALHPTIIDNLTNLQNKESENRKRGFNKSNKSIFPKKSQSKILAEKKNCSNITSKEKSKDLEEDLSSSSKVKKKLKSFNDQMPVTESESSSLTSELTCNLTGIAELTTTAPTKSIIKGKKFSLDLLYKNIL